MITSIAKWSNIWNASHMHFSYDITAQATSHMQFLWETIYGLICKERVYVRPIMYLHFTYTIIKPMLILYSSCTYHLLYLRHVIYAQRTDETLSLCPNRHKHPLCWEYKRRPSKALSPYLNHSSHRLISSPLTTNKPLPLPTEELVSTISVNSWLSLLTNIIPCWQRLWRGGGRA